MKIINRRQFMARAGRTGAALGAATLFPQVLTRAWGEQEDKHWLDLAVVQGPTAAAVEKAVSLFGGMERFVKKGGRVVLKPNMSFPAPPAAGATTSPEVVAAVASLCLKAGAGEILVLDNPILQPRVCLENSQIKSACAKIGKTRVLAVTDRKFFTEIPVPMGKALKKVEVMQDVLNADAVINLPVAKSHGSTEVSFGLKNLMGLIWDRRYFHNDIDLDQAIADLGTVIHPCLTILDATRVMTEGGPFGPGHLEYPQKIIAGINPVAVDAYGVTLSRWYDGKIFSPRQVKHILHAAELGLGEIDPAKLDIIRSKIS
ncbi:MAG: DUF362 domain-containing protein [bacterium]|nr:DUF362 domain-containing protein [bacterium]